MTLNTLLSLIKCSAINISSVFHKPKLFKKKMYAYTSFTCKMLTFEML